LNRRDHLHQENADLLVRTVCRDLQDYRANQDHAALLERKARRDHRARPAPVASGVRKEIAAKSVPKANAAKSALLDPPAHAAKKVLLEPPALRANPASTV
jgi:hypothetical protein